MFARKDQRRLCQRVGCDPQYVDGPETVAASAGVFGPDWPVIAIRHRAIGDMCGWYLWTGEFSAEPGFFRPVQAEEVWAARPELTGYLALPAGHGFVVAPGYEDVWQDPTLRNV